MQQILVFFRFKVNFWKLEFSLEDFVESKVMVLTIKWDISKDQFEQNTAHGPIVALRSTNIVLEHFRRDIIGSSYKGSPITNIRLSCL
jgi:hypothetical protein